MLLVASRFILSQSTSTEIDVTAQPAVAKFGKRQLKFNEKPSKTLENEEFLHMKIQKLETNTNHFFFESNSRSGPRFSHLEVAWRPQKQVLQ